VNATPAGNPSVINAADAFAAERSILAVRNLSVRFGGLQAVRSVSFEVAVGKITALIGPNGAGKTTVFNLITGAVPADEGVILFRGEDITNVPSHGFAGRGLSRTFQDIRLFRGMTALENVMIGFQRVKGEDFASPLFRWRQTRTAEREGARRALELMEQWRLGGVAHRIAADLSYPEQKLVAIARALAAEPKLLLLDEPLSGLSGTAVEEMLSYLSRLVQSGCALLLVEHNIGAVMRISDHIVVMHLGEKIAEGPPSAISRHARVREVYLGAKRDTRS